MSLQSSRGLPKKRRGGHRLKDIANIAFGGGGAKGVAHVGALAGLEKAGVLIYGDYSYREGHLLKRLSRLVPGTIGLSGTSIGSLIAALTASGYTSAELKAKLLDSNAMLKAVVNFQSAASAGIPTLDQNFAYDHKPAKREGAIWGVKKSAPLTVDTRRQYIRKGGWVFFGTRGKVVARNVGFFALRYAVESEIHDVLAELFRESSRRAPRGGANGLSTLDKNRLQKLAGDDIPETVYRYLGFFKGQSLVQLVSQLIYSKLRPSERELIHEDNRVYFGVKRIEDLSEAQRMRVSFARHKECFGIDLRLTGANLETQMSHVFSARTTPTMAVADAVRISASFPLLFRPTLISFEKAKKMSEAESWALSPEELTGIWIDGGIYNNVPWDVFETGLTLGLALGATPEEKRSPAWQTVHDPFSYPPFEEDEEDRLNALLETYAHSKLLDDTSRLNNSYGNVKYSRIRLDATSIDTLDIAGYHNLPLRERTALLNRNQDIVSSHLKKFTSVAQR